MASAPLKKTSKTGPYPENDIAPVETQEWRDALASVLERDGESRAHFLHEELIDDLHFFIFISAKVTIYNSF